MKEHDFTLINSHVLRSHGVLIDIRSYHLSDFLICTIAERFNISEEKAKSLIDSALDEFKSDVQRCLERFDQKTYNGLRGKL